MVGRFVLYAVIAALGVFVLTASFALEHGGGYTSNRPPVPVHDLKLLPETYKGQTVTTEGTLRYLADQQRYEVVDSDGQAVAILGYDETALQAMLDRTVIVTGRFDIDGVQGVYIDADSIGFAE
ncbi:MAG TPA: hypothetical protein VFP63_04200 [Dehalococcoidia bacterium]|nr:hypothetical protein [Dehalococcoidia bacterium]